MKSSWTQRIVFGLIGAFFLCYVGYQVYSLTFSHYETETAFTYVVSESAKISGIALRREELLESRPSTGVAFYTVTDGTKVSTGLTIAELYQNRQDAVTIGKLRDLATKKSQLEKAQDPGTTAFAHADVLNKQIFSEIGTILDGVNEGELSELPTASDKLLLLMNTKQIATGKQDNFDGAIAQVEAQEEYYKSRLQSQPRKIGAPKPGYFIKTVDGLEDITDMDKLREITPKQVEALMTRQPKTDTKRLGKLMTDHNWYFAATITEDELPMFREGRSVTLDFHISGLQPVPATIQYVNTDKETKQSAVIFESDYINETLVNIRGAKADVNFKSISGLRISRAALRFEGLQQGVYVVRGENMVFRPVEVVYEDPGFVLCRMLELSDPAYDDALQQFDEVIVEGKHLYDGKPVK